MKKRTKTSRKVKPRIAYILQDFHIGGMESILYRLAKELHLQFDFFFIATHSSDILDKFYEVGTPVYIGQKWLKLRRFLRDHQIDIVQYGNLRIYADVALSAGVPIVIERTDGIRNGVALQSKKGLSAVIASTNGTIEPISKLIRLEKIHLIYNGVDVDYLQSIEPNRLGFDDNDILIGRASRFGRGKNLSLLIKATREIVKEHPHVRLVLVGGNSKLSEGLSDEESYLRDQAKDLPDHIIFTGQVEDPESLIAGFDIGTCSSRPNNEGIPNSLIECMALKKPVISTEVDNIGELVIDGKKRFFSWR